MARLNFDLEPGDIIVVPPDSGAQVRFLEKTGRRARIVVDSAKPVNLIRNKTPAVMAGGMKRPVPTLPQ